jgi:hypothetical protein
MAWPAWPGRGITPPPSRYYDGYRTDNLLSLFLYMTLPRTALSERPTHPLRLIGPTDRAGYRSASF